MTTLMTSLNQHLYLIINLEIIVLFNHISFTHIQRDLNTGVDALSKDITLLLEIQFVLEEFSKGDLLSKRDGILFYL
jgi:hypothetical protein